MLNSSRLLINICTCYGKIYGIYFKKNKNKQTFAMLPMLLLLLIMEQHYSTKYSVIHFGRPTHNTTTLFDKILSDPF